MKIYSSFSGALIMEHRHITPKSYTLVAIDDIISRGKTKDWVSFRRDALKDRSLFNKVKKVCLAHIEDPYEQRYHFWMNYAKKHQEST